MRGNLGGKKAIVTLPHFVGRRCGAATNQGNQAAYEEGFGDYE
jgi:hypothetical protein